MIPCPAQVKPAPESTTTRQPIVKPSSGWDVVPDLIDYARTRVVFSWAAARRALDGLPLRWLGKRGEKREFTYGDLRRSAVDRARTSSAAA
jgi:hypothetical protein